MNPEQARLHEIFSEAVAKASPEEREDYLAAACGQDAELRRQVDSLLEAHALSRDFLSGNVVEPKGSSIGEGPGSVIGRYKLLEQIGEGGFGVVFMAEQREPIRRIVALKILKPGMDTKEVVARFEVGRQALALMDHPNIARVLDGGATESGRPYFVMELVKGIPITDFCNQHQLSIEERLRLFIKVCAGVQHAHQKGVIHRDLKPSNVLVTLQEGEAVPKVIDFGIAKAIGQKLTERTLFTRFEQLLGTPAYMSPEQAEWGGVDIDTRSDLYSLGVLLYELLTGTTPLEKETLSRAALDEVRRMIREVEPPKPSTRLTTLATEHSALRISHSAPHRVRGDLDWIVMKALEKHRARRYETINGMAMDIERHLNGEPVVACPPSKAYLAGKFVRKHRVGVGAVSGMALALVVGLLLALLGFSQAQRERQRAKEEASRANAIAAFLQNDLLSEANPMRGTNYNITVREVVDRAGAKIAGRFTNQPLVQAAIRGTLGNIYLFQRQYVLAEAQYQEAYATYMKKLGPEHEQTLNMLQMLVQTKNGQGKFDEAGPLARHLVEACRRSRGLGTNMMSGALFTLAQWYANQGRTEESVPLYREVLEQIRREFGCDSVKTLSVLGNLAKDYHRLGRHGEAVALYEEVVRVCRKNGGRPRYNFLPALDSLGYYYLFNGDYHKSVGFLKESVDLGRQSLGWSHPDTQQSMSWLIRAYGAMGAWESCLSLCRQGTQYTNNLKSWEDFAYNGTVAAILVRDTNAFRELAGQLLGQYSGTTNGERAREVAEICLLAPDAVPDLQATLRLAELAVDGDDPLLPDPTSHGMAEYRRGHLEAALRRFEVPRGSARGFLASQATYFCAMIHYRLGNQASARAELEEAARRLTEYVRGGLHWDWHEYGRVVAVRREAEQMILGRQVSSLLSPAELESKVSYWAPVHQLLCDAREHFQFKRPNEAGAAYLAALQHPAFSWETALSDPCWSPRAMGMSLLLAKDYKALARATGTLFSLLEVHPDPFLASQTVEITLAAPDALPKALRQKAATWSSSLKGESDRANLFRLLVAFRAGRFNDALELSKAPQQSHSSAIRGASQVLRAMSLVKLGQLEQGRQALSEAEALLAPLMAKPYASEGDACNLCFCQLALDEAHALFSQKG